MTKQPKWTPGPWCLVPGTTDIRGSIGYRIAEASIAFDFGFHPPNPDEAPANARLIAAAPELYGAAQLALQIAEDTIRSEYDGPSNSPTFNAMNAELDPVRAALSKARGEAQ